MGRKPLLLAFEIPSPLSFFDITQSTFQQAKLELKYHQTHTSPLVLARTLQVAPDWLTLLLCQLT